MAPPHCKSTVASLVVKMNSSARPCPLISTSNHSAGVKALGGRTIFGELTSRAKRGRAILRDPATQRIVKRLVKHVWTSGTEVLTGVLERGPQAPGQEEIANVFMYRDSTEPPPTLTHVIDCSYLVDVT